jgi:prophage regulatory protein
MPRLLRYDELKDKGVVWTRMHLDRLEKAGRFPRRVHLSQRTVGWIEDEIDAFLAAKLAERNATPKAA